MKHSHRLVSPNSPEYPSGLQDLESPPPIYIEGATQDRPGVAVVGTRSCTRYGVDLAEAFGSAIARCGWTTISGLARGIDAAAHRGTLRSGGHAVVILGSGIDVCYPRENIRLFEEIAAGGGAIISEYGPGTPPSKWRFPERNRLIAAMSAAVVVVEAGRKGGALITARLAAEIGRPVFVVPGDVDRAASEGCNALIKDGAHPVLGASDLVEELSLVLGQPVTRQPVGNVFGVPPTGATIEELAQLWFLSVTEVLARVGTMESRGVVRFDGQTVMPIR